MKVRSVKTRKKSVLSLCDLSGVMVKDWYNNGHDVLTVDLEDAEHSMPSVKCDILDFEPDIDYDVVFAFPPCTHLAGSGALYWEEKGEDTFVSAVKLVMRCICIAKEMNAEIWMIENPVGRLSTRWRKPDYIFDPCDYTKYIGTYDEAYLKRTCLWTNDEFTMPPKRRVFPFMGNKILSFSPSPDRAKLRSVTPRGFARAVYLYNRGY